MAVLLLGLCYGTYRPGVWFYSLYVSRLTNTSWDFRDQLSRKVKQGIVGNIVSAETGREVGKAAVVASTGGSQYPTEANTVGDYGLALDAGNYNVKISAEKFKDDSFTVSLTPDKPLLVVDRSLTPLK